MMLTPCRCRCPGDPDPPLPPPPGGWINTTCANKCIDGLLPTRWTLDFPWNVSVYPAAFNSAGWRIEQTPIAENYKNQLWTLEWDNDYYGVCVWKSPQRAWNWTADPDAVDSRKVPLLAVEMPSVPICQMSLSPSSTPITGDDGRIYRTYQISASVVVGTRFTTPWPHYELGPRQLGYRGLAKVYVDPDTGHWPKLDCNQIFQIPLSSTQKEQDDFRYMGGQFSVNVTPNYPTLLNAYVHSLDPLPEYITLTPA